MVVLMGHSGIVQRPFRDHSETSSLNRACVRASADRTSDQRLRTQTERRHHRPTD